MEVLYVFVLLCIMLERNEATLQYSLVTWISGPIPDTGYIQKVYTSLDIVLDVEVSTVYDGKTSYRLPSAIFAL
jgi:hypothetical protein